MNKSLGSALLLLLSIAVLILCFVGIAEPYHARSLLALWDSGHAVAFFLWTTLFLRASRFMQGKNLLPCLLLCLCLSLIAGGLIELIQSRLGRAASFHDLVNDLLGTAVGVFFFTLTKQKQTGQLPIACLAITLILVLAWNYRVFLYAYDEAVARRDFPVLLDFSSPLQILRLGGNAGFNAVNENKPTIRIDFETEKYSGFNLTYMPRDWRGWSMLELDLDLDNPAAKSLRLTCRIHDVQHSDGNEEYTDRFNQSFDVSAGHNLIRIDLDEARQAPAGRDLDLSRVGAIGCFTVSLDSARTIYLNSIKLTGEKQKD